MADPRSSEEATNIHGLFGAVIVEPPGARWFHPETGEEMESGLMADLYQPGKPAFREYTVFFHDELEILDKDGNPPVDHRTGLPSSTTAISYRSEPMRNRMPLTHDPADSGEDTSMSSWVYGDPAPSILRAYVGDPAKIRLVHGGIKETHVFYLHNHQWRLEADLLPEYLEATPFQLRTRTDIVGHYVHLVKFEIRSHPMGRQTAGIISREPENMKLWWNAFLRMKNCGLYFSMIICLQMHISFTACSARW